MHSLERKLYTQQEAQHIDAEEAILSAIDAQNFPDDLKLSWRAYIEEAEDEKDLNVRAKNIYEKIEKRKILDTKRFFTPKEKRMILQDPELQKEASEILNDIAQEMQKNTFAMMGEGMTAKVYASNDYPSLCYKMITNVSEYERSVTVQDEISIQDSLTKLNVNGTRVPKAFFYHMDEQNHLCVMEKLNAATLEEILLEQKKLPEDFSVDEKFENLKIFFERMHTEYGIYHRDFHNKNIMFDLEDGTIYVIDFGKAVRGVGSDSDIYRDGDIVYPLTDGQNIAQHYSTLKRFLNAKNKIKDLTI